MVVNRLLSALLMGSLVSAAPQKGKIPADIMERAMAATGIRSNMTEFRNLRISGTQLRTKSIGTCIALDTMDCTVVPYGSMDITYSYEAVSLLQRVDKVAGLGTIWYFGRPELEPMDYSMVVRDGEAAAAAITRGSYNLFDPSAPPEGYVDGYLAANMITDGYKWNPMLLNRVHAEDNYTLMYESIEGDMELPAVFDRSLNMSILLNPDTYLPFAIRTYEDHPFYGRSTNDLRLYDYVSVNGIMAPRHFKVMYNNERIITDFLASNVTVNIDVDTTFFDIPGVRQELHVPLVDPAMTAYIGEKAATFLWAGRFNRTVDEWDAQQPYPDMPGVWVVRLPGVSLYRQMLLETDTYVVVLDAPTDQDRSLMEWIRINIGKPVTQVWPTHHHHDHAFGARLFVENGAEIVAPKMATSYYAEIPGVKFATYERGGPYIVQTDNFRATFIHVEGSIHATDHSVAVVTPPCPDINSTVVVFDADHVPQGQLLPTHNDHNEIQQLVMAMRKHRVAKSAILVNVHGDIVNISDVYDGMGTLFPDFTPLDFEYRDENCPAN